MNGKGEITDVSLNCSLLNETISKITPFIEFEEIHVSRLGFHVTSWANLRKAPIVVDIGVITATIHEPLHCLPRAQRKRIRMITEKTLANMIMQGLFTPRKGSYGFADRIQDNLKIEIEKFRINFQTWGKFKTRRVGPWTPPLLQIDFDNMTIVSVDENGHEGTPDEVWAHNRHQHEIFMLYKKITLENSVSIISNNPDQQTAELLHRTSVEVQAAVKRRLRDGAVLGVQSDVTIPNVEVDIEPNFLPLMAQLAAGFQYCFAKDKSFEDPLKPRSENDVKPTSTSDHKPVIRSMSKDSADMEEELEVSEDEEDDDEIDTAEIDNASVSSSSANDINEIHIAVEENPMKQTSSHGAPLDGTNGDRPLIFLPIGLVIYEKICVTASIHHAIVRSSYTEDQNGCIQFSTKGCIAEFIWPKENKEFGMHAQLSVSFLSLQELYNQRTRTILIGGMRHEDHPSLDRPSQKPREVNLDENFPLFERRSIREDPLDLRHSFPSQAFGLKTTIEFRKSETGDDVMISHEMGVDEVDLVLDSNVCCRASRFVLNENGEGLDARWHSGDWTDELTVDMLQRPSKTLDLDDYLQETKEIFLDDNFMISSDLFNVTARLTNVELRVPAAVEENVRSCDILVELKETTFVVSSALPRTFLSGKIGSSVNGDDLEKKGIIDFPNDQSDIAYSLEKEEDPSLRQQGVATSRNISTFRAQLTLRGFQMRFVPVIPFCNAPAPQQFIAPADLAMLVCFEGEPPEPGSTYIQVALFITIQIHRLLLNVDLDLLAGATSTLLHHAGTVEATLERVNNIISSNPSPSDGDSNFDTSKVEKSLHGRRLMVKRHLSQSRETGGLAIVFCLQQAELGITIWRQNVPLVSPFRYSVAEESSSYRIQNDRHLKVLQLMHLNMKDFEIGVEFDFHANESRRTILKCCLEKANIKTCDFDKEMESQNFECQSAACDTDEPNNRLHQSRMVDVLSFGIDQLPGNLSASYSGQEKHFALRLEEQLKETRSWSLAADLTSPAIISLHVDEIKDAALLLIEALLLPTWSKRATSTGENAPFPDGSIGALFCSLVADVEESTKNVELKWDAVPENGQEPSEAFVERALRAIFKFFLPEDLRLVLLRLEVANLLVCIPVEPSLQEQNNKKLGLLLNRSDIIVRFYPVLGSQPTTLEDVLACKGVAWSSLIQTREEGYYQNISSQQSLVSIFSKENVTETDLLVHPFDIGLSYAAGEVKLAMKNDLMISDIRKIEIFIGRIINLGDRCEDHYSVMSNILQAIQKSTSAESEKVLSTIGEKAKTQLTTSNERVPGNLIQSTRAFVQRVHEELGLYEKQLRNVLSKKDAENESLKIQVFEKEKERFGALALLSSRVAGWIRIGGFHRTGQRVSRKSTMWPYWAVLRKDLLMLYTNPGEVS